MSTQTSTRTRVLTLPLLLALAVSACGTARGSEPRTLEQIVSGWQQRAEVDAVVVAVSDPDGAMHVVAAGDAAAQDRFRIGSITKTFVATTILRLAEEGVLSIDDRLDRWLDEPARFGDVTLRQMLGHTSGIPEYTSSGDFFEQLDRPWSPEEMIASIAGQAPAFPPGSDWQYSNTNYILLGQVIEVATGRHYGDVVGDLATAPAGLGQSIGTDVAVTVPGWFDIDFDGEKDDISSDPYLTMLPWAAGQMTATAGDLASFARSIFGGDLLQPSSYTEMVREHPASPRYGLGVIWKTPDGATDVVGHSGSVIGYMAVMWWVPELQRSIAVVINDSSASDPADLAELVLRSLIGDATDSGNP